MRRFIVSGLLAAAAVVAPLSVGQAQLTFGGFAGVNFSDLDVTNLDPDQTINSRTGFMVGGWIGTHLSPLFTVRLEGYWTQKGADLVENGTTVGKFKLSYIEVPLLLRVNLPLVVVKPAIYAGPAVSFETQCDAEEVSSGITAACSDFGLSLKSTDFSGIIGAGVGVGDFSLSDLVDEPNATAEAKNQTWTVRAAFGI